MNIIVDAHGGDNAPLSVLKGVELALKEFDDISITLAGNRSELESLAKKESINLGNTSFIESSKIMPVEAEPTELTRTYKDSSMAVGIQALVDDYGDAFVSAGSTGALVVGATLWVKRIKGIKRPAIGVVIPNSKGVHMLIDGGANSECRPDMLAQFGMMGSIYMREILGVSNPRVGMVNIGTEPNKGLDLQIEASKLLSEMPLNFIGNIEASKVPLGGCDVAVTDGFTGNIMLKLTEGMAKMMGGEIKNIIMSGFFTKIAGLMIRKEMGKMKAKLDPSEYGGTPLLGVKKPVIKAHGSSNAVAIKNAIKQAKNVVEHDIIGQIEKAITETNEKQD